MGSNDFDNGGNNDTDKYYNLNNASNAYYAGDESYSGFDRETFQPSSSAAVSLREQSVLVKSIAFMCLALLISAVSAILVYGIGKMNPYLYFNMMIPAIVIELIVFVVASIVIRKGNTVLGTICYVAYAVMSGVSLSVIFFAYSLGSIVSIFIITAIMFGAMAVYGYTTKADLKPLGTFFAMALIGLVCVGLLNLFMHSDSVSNIIAVVGVVLFAGITAYDIQRLKEMNVRFADSSETAVALYGGLQLYLDFINIFLKLLRLFGRVSRK